MRHGSGVDNASRCGSRHLGRGVLVAALALLAPLAAVPSTAGATEEPELAKVAFDAKWLYSEEDAGTVQTTLTRSGNVESAVAVDYVVSTFMATPGVDFVLEAGTIPFAAGQTQTTLSMEILDDARPENFENALVELVGGDGVTVGDENASQLFEFWITKSDQQPDLMVSTQPRDGYVGNDVHNTTGRKQTVTLTARRGEARSFWVRVGNDGTTKNQFALRDGDATATSRVRYFRLDADITAAMRSDAGWPVKVAKRKTKRIRVMVTAPPRADVGSEYAAVVKAVWRGDGTRKDVVRAVLRVVR